MTPCLLLSNMLKKSNSLARGNHKYHWTLIWTVLQHFESMISLASFRLPREIFRKTSEITWNFNCLPTRICLQMKCSGQMSECLNCCRTGLWFCFRFCLWWFWWVMHYGAGPGVPEEVFHLVAGKPIEFRWEKVWELIFEQSGGRTSELEAMVNSVWHSSFGDSVYARCGIEMCAGTNGMILWRWTAGRTFLRKQ